MIKYILLLLCVVVSFIGCIEDRVDFARLEINNKSTSDVLYVLEWQNHSNKTSDTIFNNTIYIHQETLLESHLDELVSIEFIKINNQKSIIYFSKSVDENNYNQNIDRTIFNINNWDEFSRDDYQYTILDTDFD